MQRLFLRENMKDNKRPQPNVFSKDGCANISSPTRSCTLRPCRAPSHEVQPDLPPLDLSWQCDSDVNNKL